MLLALGMRIATRAAQRNVNTVTTNVPGPQFPLYAAGRRMLRAFPYVPLGGQIRLGIAIFSYDGEVNFGITGDYDTTPDIDVLAHGIEDGMAQLLKAVTRLDLRGQARSGIVSTSASKYLRSPDTITCSTDLPSTGTCTLRSPSIPTTELVSAPSGPGSNV